MRLIFIRHAEPDYENDTLTEKGFREAKCLAKHYSDKSFDCIYCSPLPRAQLTCRAVIKNKKINSLDWLTEFQGKINTEDPRKWAWDISPKLWNEYPNLVTDDFLNTPLFENTNVKEKRDWVYKNFDKLLAKHGYVRDLNCYKVEKGNVDTIVFFCHFAITSVMISRLMNVPYLNVVHNFACPPSGVTEFISEEREKGYANFRMVRYGDTSHLLQENEPVSPMGRSTEFQK